MRILKLELTHFGKFHNRLVPFQPGLNVIYGKNEAGKTTIHAFIRAMFFGLSETEKEYYRPWEDQGGFGGALYLEKGSDTYQIRRDFDADTMQLFKNDEDTPMDDPVAALEELLAPMTEENFNNILHIAQMQDRFFSRLTAGYRKEQEQLDASLAEVREALLAQEKEVEECKKDVASTAEQLKELETTRKEHSDRFEADLAAYEKNLSEKETQVQSLFQSLASAIGGKQVKKGSYGAGILFLLLAAAGSAMYFYCSELNLMDYIPYTMYGTAGALGLGVLILLFRFLINAKNKKIFALQQEADAAGAELEQLISEKPVPDTHFQAECIEKRKELENYILEIKDHLEDVQACMHDNMTLYHNLQQERKANHSSTLLEKASALFREVSGHVYREITLENDGTLTLHNEEKSLPLRRASRGTSDQVYFCIRLAAADLLGSEDSFPVFLDDVFAFYDEERLEQILKVMRGRKNQAILFTCHKREHNLLTVK